MKNVGDVRLSLQPALDDLDPKDTACHGDEVGFFFVEERVVVPCCRAVLYCAVFNSEWAILGPIWHLYLTANEKADEVLRRFVVAERGRKAAVVSDWSVSMREPGSQSVPSGSHAAPAECTNASAAKRASRALYILGFCQTAPPCASLTAASDASSL